MKISIYEKDARKKRISSAESAYICFAASRTLIEEYHTASRSIACLNSWHQRRYADMGYDAVPDNENGLRL